MTLPNFLVIGAGRSGTTSLQHYLAQHPQIFMAPAKAPSHFFCRDISKIEDPYLRWVTRHYFVPHASVYASLFDGVTNQTAIGEVSPVYLAATFVAERIAAQLLHARLIALLRHPIERVFARFVARSRDGLEHRTLKQIIETERADYSKRDNGFGTYLASACSQHFLSTYFVRFPRDQIRVHLFEDFVSDTQTVMQDLFEFLAVDPTFLPDTRARHNESTGLIRNTVLRSIWTRTGLARAMIRGFIPSSVRDTVFAGFTRELEPVTMEAEIRADLQRLFHDDIEKLQDLIDRDLSHWLVFDTS